MSNKSNKSNKSKNSIYWLLMNNQGGVPNEKKCEKEQKE